MKFSAEGLTNFFGSKEKSSFGEPIKDVIHLSNLLEPGSSILDLGAGDGRNSIYLASSGMEVEAFDLSEAGITKLQKLSKEAGVLVKTEVADASTYEIKQEYDALIVVLLLQFLSEEESMRLLNDIKLNTKEGGYNIVHIFTKSGDREKLDLQEDPNSKCFYPQDYWLKDFYKDWQIIEHSLVSAPLIGKTKEDGMPVTSVVEKILVKKV